MNKNSFSWIGAVMAAVGVCFLCAGIVRGEIEVVYSKAVQICLECIGIG